MIFKLERRGQGWGEAVFPSVVVEHRPVESWSGGKASSSSAKGTSGEAGAGAAGHKRRGQTSGNSKYILLEEQLLALGLTAEEVNDVISVAVAWRVTKGGQILVDRRRRAKALRNVRTLVPFLESLGLQKQKPQREEASNEEEEEEAKTVGDLVAKVPLLILCNVESSDHWDRRAVQLAAHWYSEGGGSFPSPGAIQSAAVAAEGEGKGKHSASDLKRWIHRVRQHKAVGKLSTDQVKLLEQIGFDFGLGITSEWEAMFDKLLDFMLESGHSQVMPAGVHKRNSLSLHEWTELQRIAYWAGRLSPDHVERLESINFDWTAKYVSRWLLFYQDYRGLLAEGGTMRLSAVNGGHGAGEGASTIVGGSSVRVRAGGAGGSSEVTGRRFWRQKQQVLWYTNAILPERLSMLKEAAFGFDPYRKKFREVCGVVEALQGHYKVSTMLELLVRLYDDLMVPEEGGFISSKLERSQVRQLARWMKIQLVLEEQGIEGAFSSQDRARLDSLGMLWEGLEWQMNFEALLKFRAVNGHCDVGKDHRLSAWVVNMRQTRHDLPFEYKSLLDMVGFTWEKRGAWSRMFAQLSQYHEENGHVNIERQSRNNLNNHLGAWVTNQRALWRMGKLSHGQISRLEMLGVRE